MRSIVVPVGGATLAEFALMPAAELAHAPILICHSPTKPRILRTPRRHRRAGVG